MKRPTMMLAGIFLAVVAGVVFWHPFHTGVHAAVAQVTELQMAATATDSVPAPMNKSTDGNPASGDPAQLTYEDERRRLNKAVLERYYPDLRKETGFTSDDYDKLVYFRGSDEAELEKGLGSAQYQRWKEYEIKVQSQDMVSKLGGALPGDDQLRDEQADMLFRAIFAERRRRDEELRLRACATPSDPRSRVEFEFGNLEIKEDSDRSLISAAKSFLTERQFAALSGAVTDPNLAGYRENLQRIRAGMQNRSAQ